MFRRGALELGQPFIPSDRIVEAAQDYHWPGNLRELRNFVTRTLILRDVESAYNDLRAKTRTRVAAPVEDTQAEVAMNRASSLLE
jgi:two-component system response regulator AtoC